MLKRKMDEIFQSKVPVENYIDKVVISYYTYEIRTKVFKKY